MSSTPNIRARQVLVYVRRRTKRVDKIIPTTDIMIPARLCFVRGLSKSGLYPAGATAAGTWLMSVDAAVAIAVRFDDSRPTRGFLWPPPSQRKRGFTRNTRRGRLLKVRLRQTLRSRFHGSRFQSAKKRLSSWSSIVGWSQ